MRILLCTGEFPPDPTIGGIATAVRSAACALAAAGFDTHVLHVSTTASSQDHHDPRGFTVHHRPLLGTLPGPWARSGAPQAFSFRKHADGLGTFDIVEAPDWEAAVAGFVVARRQPVVASLYTPTEVVRAHGSRAGSTVRARIERWACARADATVGSGRTLVDDLLARGWRLPPDRRVVQPPCADPDLLDLPPACLPERPLLLGVGRLEARKGFDLLIRAAALLPSRPEVVLVGRDVPEPGSTTDGRALAGLADRLDVPLRLAGSVPLAAVRSWYDRSWALVVPSTFESFSMAALESACRGRAVVGTDRIGFVDLASDRSGIAAAAERTAEALAEALAPIMTDHRSATEAGRAARSEVERSFSGPVFAARRDRLYRSLV